MGLIGRKKSLNKTLLIVIILLLVLTVVGAFIAKILWDRNTE